ncbi:hypothetical protein [Devosia psychrophila]|uniref:Uncharacterized protein n=1 Tax=Devosia psychrophila TaxID=728005 RepID=A0A0F5PVH7_9HYPH|nr:hypothetical protein [Devosia psychrophila]KKC32600.1 hypothetical protein WH91_12240 [Devosia psychrophila]SFC49355.1 hypothetical protein SAMN04488059_1062 [Devosia psychrophila]
MSGDALRATSNIRGLSPHNREALTAIAKLYDDKPTIMTRKQIIGKMRTPSSLRTMDRAINKLEAAGIIRRRTATEPAKMHLLTIEIMLSSKTEKQGKSNRPTGRQKSTPKRRSIERQDGAPYIPSKYSPYTPPKAKSDLGIMIDVSLDPELYAECCRVWGKDPSCEELHTPRITVIASIVEKARQKLASSREL